MAKTRIFIDGSEGTTGLRIHERFASRNDVEVIPIDPEKRKDPAERGRLINESDITFLCLPDAASKESVSLVHPDNTHTKIIDTSTAHRTDADWAYGFPELAPSFRAKIKESRRIAVPGCYASGFAMLAYPMTAMGIISPEYPLSCTALSGYSGAGKKAIALYESPDKSQDLFAPREYALSQQHKHLKEMKAISGLAREPLFTPVVDDYYCGMVVSIPMYTHLLDKKVSPEELQKEFAAYYQDQQFIHVMPFGSEAEGNGFFAANAMAGRDDAQIYITGNEDRLLLTARFDNLGKGASGAAVQCMNIAMGLPEETGLVLGE